MRSGKHALQREYERVQPREVLVPDPLPVALDIMQHPAAGFSPYVSTLGRAAFPSRNRPISAAYPAICRAYAWMALAVRGIRWRLRRLGRCWRTCIRPSKTLWPISRGCGSTPRKISWCLMKRPGATSNYCNLPCRKAVRARCSTSWTRTVTAMGGRLLRQWLSQPLRRLQPLQARQDAVQRTGGDAGQTGRPSARPSPLVADLERIVSRLSLGSVCHVNF